MKNTLNAAYRITAIVCTLLVLIARPAHAYLDPGTGSYATQIVLAGIVGTLFSAKLILQGIARFFRSLLPLDKTATASAASVATVSSEEPTHGGAASSAE